MVEAAMMDTGEGDHELAASLHRLEHRDAVAAQHTRRDERHQLEQQVRLRPALRRQVSAERGLESLRCGCRDDIPASRIAKAPSKAATHHLRDRATNADAQQSCTRYPPVPQAGHITWQAFKCSRMQVNVGVRF